jgi:hypothetical protein
MNTCHPITLGLKMADHARVASGDPNETSTWFSILVEDFKSDCEVGHSLAREGRLCSLFAAHRWLTGAPYPCRASAVVTVAAD